MDEQPNTPGPSAKEFGEHVQRLRRGLGLDVDELAVRAGLDVATIEELEAGAREPIYAEMWALSVGLGMSMGTLFRFWERRSLVDGE